MKKYFGILAASALAACGSSSNNGGTAPPPLSNFTYSTPAPANSTQAASASNAQQQVPDVVGGATSGSATQAADAPQLADSISSEALDARLLPPSPAFSVVGELAKIRKGNIDNSDCYTTTATTLTYNNCTDSADGYTITLNGSLSVGTNSVTWDLTYTGSFSSSGESINENGEWKGNITVTGNESDGTITGSATSTFSGTIVDSSTTESYAYTAGVDFLDLAYTSACQSEDGFFVSGTLEVRRNVAESGTFTAPVDNAAVEFVWNGCNSVSVAIGSD
jgi:hypothetical protein